MEWPYWLCCLRWHGGIVFGRTDRGGQGGANNGPSTDVINDGQSPDGFTVIGKPRPLPQRQDEEYAFQPPRYEREGGNPFDGNRMP